MLCEQNRLHEALDFYNEADELLPHDPEVSTVLRLSSNLLQILEEKANVLIKMENYDEALRYPLCLDFNDYFGGTIDKVPEPEIDHLMLKALALTHLQKAEQALAIYNGIIEKDHYNSGAYLAKALLLRNQGI